MKPNCPFQGSTATKGMAQILTMPFISCVLLGEIVNLSSPPFILKQLKITVVFTSHYYYVDYIR